MLHKRPGSRKDKELIFRGNRAVFWSVEQQRIMDEHQIEEQKELRDCVVAKFPIVSYSDGGAQKMGQSLSKISDLYENVQLLVFCEEPWRLLGA